MPNFGKHEQSARIMSMSNSLYVNIAPEGSAVIGSCKFAHCGYNRPLATSPLSSSTLLTYTKWGPLSCRLTPPATGGSSSAAARKVPWSSSATPSSPSPSTHCPRPLCPLHRPRPGLTRSPRNCSGAYRQLIAEQ